MTQRRKGGLGWRPALRTTETCDSRYHLTYCKVYLRLSTCVSQHPILDQGSIGSCTANALSGALQFDRRKNNLQPDFVPSRLFIYYNERVIEGDVPLDAGAFLRDGMQSLAQTGVCPENSLAIRPDAASQRWRAIPGRKSARDPAATAMLQRCCELQESWPTKRLIRPWLSSRGTLAQGIPFVFGFSVYDSLWDSSGNPNTIIPLPSGSDSRVGGHAVLVVGYDDSKALFTIHNSWGTAVGDAGYFYIPYGYVTDSGLSADFWIIQTTSN